MKTVLSVGLLSSLVFIASTSAQAAPQKKAAATGFRSGFYLAGSAGVSWANADWRGLSTLSAINDDDTQQVIFESWTPQGDEDSTEFAGRVALGYQLVHKSLYLAGELGGTFATNHEFTGTTQMNFGPELEGGQTLAAKAAVTDKVTLNGSEFTIDLRPGYLLVEQFLVYGRMGISFNKLTAENSAVWTQLNNDGIGVSAVTVEDSSASSNKPVGIRLGLGAEYLFSKHWGVFVDYIYTNYGTVDTFAEGEAIVRDYNALYGADNPVVTVIDQSAMLGLMVHW